MLVEPTAPDPLDRLGARPGQTLDGRYEVERVLGQGGMGVVVAARHLELDDRVAIKLILPELAGTEALSRFLNEARASRKIKSEHAAKVLDVGRLRQSETPFMVMELLSGADLRSLVQEQGPLEPVVAVAYLLQACEALAEAHTLGIVHRDMKPANLFLTFRADGSPCIKVLDFGIAKLLTPEDGSPSGGITRTTGMMGTAYYAAPEQLQSAKNADARSDIWSLGVTLYELLTGELPFAAENMADLVVKIMTAEPERLPAHLDAGLAGVIYRCLDKNRETRYSHVGELATALQPFAPSRSLASIERIQGTLAGAGFKSDPKPVTVIRTGDSTSTGTARTVAVSNPPPPAPRKRRLPFALAGGLLLVGLVGVVALQFRPSSPEAHRSAASANTQAPRATPASALPPRSAPLPAEVEITVQGAPPQAKVRLGDAVLGNVPGPFRFPRGSTSLSLTVEAEGFRPTTVQVIPITSATLPIALEPLPPPAAAGSLPAPKTPPARPSIGQAPSPRKDLEDPYR